MNCFDTQTDARDLALLERDPYTFAVLRRILQGPCRRVCTDHETFILCHSEPPYPVWIYTAEGLTQAQLEAVWQLSDAETPLREGFRYNLKKSLADFFIRKAAARNEPLAVTMRLLAYDCPSPVAPEACADGHMHLCTEEDLANAMEFERLFHEETGERDNPETRRTRTLGLIRSGGFYLWKNGEGQAVASCIARREAPISAIGLVYTLPAFRRRHYAQRLVYEVSCAALQEGLIPALYTDGDYAASNACYQKIGYRLQGELCTLAAKACMKERFEA